MISLVKPLLHWICGTRSYTPGLLITDLVSNSGADGVIVHYPQRKNIAQTTKPPKAEITVFMYPAINFNDVKLIVGQGDLTCDHTRPPCI